MHRCCKQKSIVSFSCNDSRVKSFVIIWALHQKLFVLGERRGARWVVKRAALISRSINNVDPDTRVNCLCNRSSRSAVREIASNEPIVNFTSSLEAERRKQKQRASSHWARCSALLRSYSHCHSAYTETMGRDKAAREIMPNLMRHLACELYHAVSMRIGAIIICVRVASRSARFGQLID